MSPRQTVVCTDQFLNMQALCCLLCAVMFVSKVLLISCLVFMGKLDTFMQETQTKPEGQIHFFPVLFKGDKLYDLMVERCGSSQNSAPDS